MEARSQKGTTYNIVKGEIKPKMGEISKNFLKSFKNWRKKMGLLG